LQKNCDVEPESSSHHQQQGCKEDEGANRLAQQNEAHPFNVNKGSLHLGPQRKPPFSFIISPVVGQLSCFSRVSPVRTLTISEC
jgi:hypothetical protein